MEPGNLASTLFFPFSGDPTGFHHLAVAEWALRKGAGLERVEFILSNGHHPDPTKPGARAPAEARLRLAQLMLAEAGDAERSFFAARARAAGEKLLCGPERLSISTLELSYSRAVRTAESVSLLRQGRSERLHLYAGADLLRRMADPRIFSGSDLATLSEGCTYWILDRGAERAEEAMRDLSAQRGQAFDFRELPAADVPDWLAAFLPLSSTHIRHAAEAGDPLEGMVTRSAAAEIRELSAYRDGTPAYHIADDQARPAGTRTAWQWQVERLRRDLWEAAGPIHASLVARADANLPRTLAVVETSAAGALTWALAGRSGASRFFVESRFAYDRHAKLALLGKAPAHSAVSAEMVASLAQAMRQAAGADFALAESGMAGPPDGKRQSLKQGECWLAFATPEGVQTRSVHFDPFLTRQEHQLLFATEALRWIAPLVALPGR
jgi:nicotinamide-nucleotide amidase